MYVMCLCLLSLTPAYFSRGPRTVSALLVGNWFLQLMAKYVVWMCTLMCSIVDFDLIVKTIEQVILFGWQMSEGGRRQLVAGI